MPGGTVHLKTDSEFFYRYTKETVCKWGAKIIQASENFQNDDSMVSSCPYVVSAYETKARAKRMRIHYLVFRFA
jgi:tRNA G46 methylase TrmB